jgi:hypothetical protein
MSYYIQNEWFVKTNGVPKGGGTLLATMAALSAGGRRAAYHSVEIFATFSRPASRAFASKSSISSKAV